MKASFLVVVIAMMHILVVGGVLFIQGCGTVQQDKPEPAPAPVMPSPGDQDQPEKVEPTEPKYTPPKPDEEGASADEEKRSTATDIKTYTVKQGDMLSRIASKFDVSVRELSEVNDISDPDKIRVGQELVLPAYAKAPEESSSTSSAPEPDKESRPEVEPGETYEVQSGDALSKIAARYGTTVEKLKEVNDLDSSKILVGQELRIPKGAAEKEEGDDSDDASEEDEAEKEDEGEGREARAGVSGGQDSDDDGDGDEEIEAEDTVSEADTSRRGEGRGEEGVSSLFSSQEPFQYTVSEGETLMEIAKAYVVNPRELRELNNLDEDEEVEPGQKILIPLSDL